MESKDAFISQHITQSDVNSLVKGFAQSKGYDSLNDPEARRVAYAFLNEFVFYIYDRGRQDERKCELFSGKAMNNDY